MRFRLELNPQPSSQTLSAIWVQVAEWLERLTGDCKKATYMYITHAKLHAVFGFLQFNNSQTLFYPNSVFFTPFRISCLTLEKKISLQHHLRPAKYPLHPRRLVIPLSVHWQLPTKPQAVIWKYVFQRDSALICISFFFCSTLWRYLCIYTRKNATELLQPVAPSGLIQVWYHNCIRLLSPIQTVQDWRCQTGTVCWVVSAVSVWCNRIIQVCWEQTVAVCKNRL